MRLTVLCLTIFLLCTASEVAQSRRKQPRSASQSRIVSNIQQVDFSNFSYPVTLFSPQCGMRKIGTVRMVNGEGSTRGECQLFASKVSTGDLTGDGNEIAMVNIGCNCGVTGVNREAINAAIYFYQLQSGQVKLLGSEPSRARRVSDYTKYYPTSSDENLDVFMPTIKRGLLTYKVVTRIGPERNPDSKFGAQLQYRWNGRGFVLAGKPERWRCADYDCELQ